jgi:16S rRNA (guanine527-N7)-methyltransferase
MQLLKKFLENELNIADEKIIDKFKMYNEYLMEWNSKINLVSRKTASIESHILNSIFFLKEYRFKKDISIVDIGTGGGFPGIPLKILMNDLKIVCVDSIQKKIKALEDIIIKLGLQNVKAICGRAEEISKKKEYSHKFDIVIAKSVSTLGNLYNWTNDLVKKNGDMVFIKGGDINSELLELKTMYKRIIYRKIDFTFDNSYGIEDKKIVLIKN